MKTSSVLKELMRRHGRKGRPMSQTALAEKTGVSQGTISKIINEVQEPDVASLIAFRQFFGVSMDQLLGFEPLDIKELSRESIQIALIAEDLPPEVRRSLLQSAEEKKFWIEARGRREVERAS